ncbi:unnamed protein product [Citrullus colocynthis]|uniref:Uncharacterized protein n=1 Tax=Citrullus colocynthis TaxID=252529 RepID=A0ABP0XWH9_9ROSI
MFKTNGFVGLSVSFKAVKILSYRVLDEARFAEWTHSDNFKPRPTSLGELCLKRNRLSGNITCCSFHHPLAGVGCSTVWKALGIKLIEFIHAVPYTVKV